MIAWLLPALAFAFSSAPSRSCDSDTYCVLVRETYCGEVSAIALGHDEAWAKWESKLRAKDEKAGRVCPAGPRSDPRNFEARCQAGECVAVRKGRSPEGK